MKIEEVSLAEYKAYFINKIPDEYPELRQKSKTVTFALQYQGTAYTLVNNSGFDIDEAKQIIERYHNVYQVAREYTAKALKIAGTTGYVNCAFGLRLRTPLLKQTLLNKKSTPYEATKESRTAGNALSQSYGTLNNRAAIEFMDRVHNSKYIYDIKPIAQIHDAQYFLVRDQVGIVEWFNKNLVECMEWQNLPELQHPKVHLGGEIEIYYPSWASKIKIPNNASKKEILDLCNVILF